MGILLALIITLATTYQGYRSYHSDPSRKGKRLTAGLSLCVVIASGVSAYNQSKTSDALQRLVNTNVEFHYAFRSTPFDSSDTKHLTIFENVVPRNNEARDLHVIQGTFGISGQIQDERTNQAAWNQFVQQARTERERAVHADIGRDNSFRVDDLSLPIRRIDLAEMKQHRSRIYLFSFAWWKNVSGTRDSACICQFLANDITPDDGRDTVSEQPPLHICPCSTEDFAS